MSKIKYIGVKPFIDRLYRTGLIFETGQVRDVPNDVARKLLNHVDLFTPVEVSNSPKEQDDTKQLLEQAGELEKQKADEQSSLSELYQQVSLMDKDALAQFAFDNYQHEINKRKSLDNLRDEVIGLIDQFGVV